MIFKDGQKPVSVSQAEAGLASGISIASWSPEEAEAIYNALEHPNWAPWLEASPSSLAGRAKVFPAGQLVMKSPEGDYIGSLSLNQIHWDGNISHLPSWDAVAGDPTDYSTTYKPDGNTLVLLSMNVAPAWKGMHIPGRLVGQAKQLAGALGTEYLIGSFRPSGYGEAKKGMGYDIDFTTYCKQIRLNSTKPVDPWLGSLWHLGMKMLKVDDQAMTVLVPVSDFLSFRQGYKADSWQEIAPAVWECGEVGQWQVNEASGNATYQESNVWGMLPTAS